MSTVFWAVLIVVGMNSASIADRAIGWVDVDDLSKAQIDRSVKVGGRQICL